VKPDFNLDTFKCLKDESLEHADDLPLPSPAPSPPKP